MKQQRTFPFGKLIICILAILLLAGLVVADWMKMDPPSDVDKKSHGHTNKPTCWLATASNMLAGAGYGTGTDVQTRADNIYTDLVTHYGTNNSGWADVAVKWWLNSSNNNQKTSNPLRHCEVYGYKEKQPYLHNFQSSGGLDPTYSDDTMMFLGNSLRDGNSVGVSLSWWGSNMGHAITAWGDSGDANDQNSNPAKMFVTDSDKDTWGDVQKYTTTLAGSGLSIGWYMYSNNAFIKHLAMLETVDDPNDDANCTFTQTVSSSYKVYNNHRSCFDCNIIGVSYKVTSGLNILTYRTGIDWQTSNPLDIVEDPCKPRLYFDASCDLSDNPVPFGNGFTIDTDLVLPYYPNQAPATMSTNIHLSYPPVDPTFAKPGFEVKLGSDVIRSIDATDPNITGGYVIGTFGVYDNNSVADEPNTVAVYRFCIGYDYFQNPENHYFTLTELQGETIDGFEQDAYIGNFRFGHSHGVIKSEQLWEFDDWLVEEYENPPYEQYMPGNMIAFDVSLPGVLPYPQAENYIAGPLPGNCGDLGTVYLPADLNRDCKVDFADFAEFATDWVKCTDPNDPSCLPCE